MKTCIAKKDGQYFPDVLANDYVMAASLIMMGTSQSSPQTYSFIVGPNFVYASNIISSYLTILSSLEIGNVNFLNASGLTLSYESTSSITFSTEITIWNPCYFLQGVTFLMPVLFSAPMTANSFSLGDLSALSLDANSIYADLANISNLTSNSIETNLLEASITTSSQFNANMANIENAYIAATAAPIIFSNDVVFCNDLTVSEKTSSLTLIGNSLYVGTTYITQEELTCNVPSHFSNLYVEDLDCDVVEANVNSAINLSNSITAQGITLLNPQLESLSTGNLYATNACIYEASLDSLSMSFCNVNTINSNHITTSNLNSPIFYSDFGNIANLITPILYAQVLSANNMNTDYANIDTANITTLSSTFLNTNTVFLEDIAGFQYLNALNLTSNCLLSNSIVSNSIAQTAQTTNSNITIAFTSNFISNLLTIGSVSNTTNLTANMGNIYALISTTTNANIFNCEALTCYDNASISDLIGANSNITSLTSNSSNVTSLLSASTTSIANIAISNMINASQSSFLYLEANSANITNFIAEPNLYGNIASLSYFGTLLDTSSTVNSSIITNTNAITGQTLNAQNINFNSSDISESTFTILNSNTINSSTFTGDTCNTSNLFSIYTTSPNGTFQNANIANEVPTTSISADNACIQTGYLTNMTVSTFVSNANLTSDLSCTTFSSNTGNLSFNATDSFIPNVTTQTFNCNNCTTNAITSNTTLTITDLTALDIVCSNLTNITETLTSNNAYSNSIYGNNIYVSNVQTSNLSTINIICIDSQSSLMLANTVTLINPLNSTNITITGNGNIQINNNFVGGSFTAYINNSTVTSISMSDTLTTQNLNVLDNLSIPSLSSNDMTVTESLTVSAKSNVTDTLHVRTLECNTSSLSTATTTTISSANNLTFIAGTITGTTNINASTNINATSNIRITGNLKCNTFTTTTVTGDNLTVTSLTSNSSVFLATTIKGNLTANDIKCTANISGTTIECNSVTCSYLTCTNIFNAPSISVETITPETDTIYFLSPLSVTNAGIITCPDVVLNNSSINAFMQSIATNKYITSCVASMFAG